MSLTEVRQTFVEPFMEGLTMVASDWQQGFQIRRDDVFAWKMASLSGIGAIPVWDGSNDVATADVNDRYNTTVSYTKYALQARINKYDRKDLPGITADAATKLGISAMSTYATVAAGLLNNAWGSTQAGDGDIAALVVQRGDRMHEREQRIGQYPSEIGIAHLRDAVPYQKASTPTASRPELAEFFGVAPGAYTGAERKGREGKFKVADDIDKHNDEVARLFYRRK